LTQLRTNLLQPTISYTQEWQDRLKQDPIVAVKGIVFSDKTGTLYIDESDDKSTITQLAEKLVSANVTSEQDWVKLTKRWYRFRYVNGASAQGEFILLQDIDKSGELRSGILASPGVVVNTQLIGSIMPLVDSIIPAFAVSTTAVPQVFTNQNITVHILSGNCWFNTSATATTVNGFKLLPGMPLDLRVNGTLSLISDTTGASVQIVVWED